MKKELLKKKIVMALCLSVACGVSPAYAASVTNTTSYTYGYQAGAAGETITLPDEGFTASVDNSGWHAAFTDATAYGFMNGGYTGVTLRSTLGQDLTFTAVAKGGNTTVVSSGNLQTLARGDVIGIFGWGGNTTIAGNARIGAAATGGHAVTVSSSNSATADATGYASGIIGRNYGTVEVTGNATIQATATGGSASATCKDTPSNDYYSHAFSHATAYGIYVDQHSSATIRGDANIQVTATGGSAWAYLHSMADAESYAEAYGISSVYNSTTTIGGNTNIRVTATGGQGNTGGTWSYAKAYGIYGYSYGTATIGGDTAITATATVSDTNAKAYAYALYADNYSTISINQTSGQAHTVRLTGDVAANDHSVVNLTLNNGSSFLRGNVLANSDSSVNFTLVNGAKWQPVYNNSNGTYNADNSSIFSYGSLASYATAYSTGSNYIGTLTLNGGIIDLTWDNPARTSYRTLTIDSLSGSGGTIRMATDLANAHSGDRVTLATDSAVTLGVAITYDPIMTQLSGLGYHATGGYSPVTGSGTGSVTLTGTTSENKAYSYVPVFSGSSIIGLELGVSSNTKAAADAASSQASLTQIGVNHLRKRLGDLRESPATEDGAWARIYSGNVTNDQYGEVASDYKGMQLGYDQSTPVKSGRKYTGAAFSYTGADNSFSRGGGSSKAYDFALYQTWIGNNGQYYDIIAKRGRLSSDYHVTDLSDNYSTADYKTWTDSLSAEYGVRKQLIKGWYIEPQVELTFGRVKGVDYTTSSGMTVQQDSINRLTGRMGAGLGKKLSNGNHLYSSLSVLHEFSGEENIKADSLNYSQDMSGTWYELIVGMNAKMSNHSTGYLNVEKLFGGNVHSNWQINGGCRWSF